MAISLEQIFYRKSGISEIFIIVDLYTMESMRAIFGTSGTGGAGLIVQVTIFIQYAVVMHLF